MIRLTLDLPATATELSDYAALVSDIDPDLEVRLVGPEPFELSARIGERTAPPVEPPAPAKVAKADKRVARKVSPTAGRKQPSRSERGPTAADKILTELRTRGGTFVGPAAELIRRAGIAKPDAGVKAVARLELTGEVTIDREGRTITAIHLAGTTARPDLRPVPTAATAPTPESPARPAAAPLAPPANLKPPARGWA